VLLEGAVLKSLASIRYAEMNEELLVSSQYRKAASLFTDMLRRRTFIVESFGTIVALYRFAELQNLKASIWNGGVDLHRFLIGMC